MYRIHPRSLHKRTHTKTCIRIFVAAFLVMAKIWRQHKWPSVGERISKCYYIPKVEYYTAITPIRSIQMYKNRYWKQIRGGKQQIVKHHKLKDAIYAKQKNTPNNTTSCLYAVKVWKPWTRRKSTKFMDLDCLWAWREETEPEEGKKRILTLCYVISFTGFPGGASGKQLACQCSRRHRRCRKIPASGRPWRSTWRSTPSFLPAESHGRRTLVSYSP